MADEMDTNVPDKFRYTTVAIALHWAIAAFIIFNLGLGFVMEGLAPELKRTVIPLHVSSGITVLLLTVLRIAWRLTHRPPPFSAGLMPWERVAANLAHGFLYFMTLAMPLTGWSIISANPPRPGPGGAIWGLLPLPSIAVLSRLEAVLQKTVHDSFVEAHAIGAWILLALLFIHVAAALKHQFYDRHAEFARMGVGSFAARE
jgi:cytochrome b561